ncbi:DNA-dependent metalloprotease SPRTN [Aquila chrysaetos chrysaetos]|uniref:DNA-dependent metalloprotease SPRTN n=1 Tax=Aquila chrysaetos chrysaetos TaxID=223781 RepID=A0A663E5A1_AQUCH|nr:DNA-dependent metalloprotease SPRTN [Aquila chrysaetos chrysaetos]
MEEEDFVLALQLQELWEAEDKEAEEEEEEKKKAAACSEASPDPSQLRSLSVVDEAWELLDPSPDVHGLFVQFNQTLFWGRLAAVEVSWSPRMTLCAGVCRYEGKGGMCSIRLSEPLLKLRPRKDLVETLLHEMIHALLFVTNNDKDRESHGPEFRKHMRRINRLTGANVTIYHTFHDEVDLYRQHWWRCNGPCQNRKPYFGYVKRSMNRAPSARDFWWVEHQETCGGTFTKVKEPENFSKKSKEKTQPAKLPNSEATNKGKAQMRDTQNLMPFSGKGYQLGGGESGLSEKNTNSSSSVRNSETPGSQHRSAVRTIPIPKNEIKFEKSPRSGIFFPLYTDDASEKINLASKREFPKLSVADTKAYKNVSGSPVKIARVMEEKSNQGSANGKRVIPLHNRPLKQICFEQTTAAQVASEKKSSESTNTLQRWPKMEDKTAFENYFIKKESTALSINTPMKTKAESTVSSASSSTAVRQDEKVSCPVCQTEVLESKINEHLDSCLA